MITRTRIAALGRAQSQLLALLVTAFTAISFPSASAQTTESPSPTGASSLTPSTLATSFTNSGILSSLSDIAAATSTSIAPSSRPSSIDTAPDTSFSNGDDDNDDSRDGMDDHRGGLINYYFVFLGLFIVLAFLGIYFLNRRRQARKEAWLASGQHALRQDMDGWTSNARRWQRRNEANRREGLDEYGQAPPPYVAKQDVRVEEREDGRAGGELQIPLRTLPRDERERDMAKPPGYLDAVRGDSTAGQHPPSGPGGASSSPSAGASGQPGQETRPS